MNLSEHFTLDEMTASETAARKDLFNVPTEAALANMRRLCESLELVRLITGKPIHINSGYRSPAVNRAVGGSPNSAHKFGLAADIICPAFGSPLKLCQAIAAQGIDFDTVIHEFGAWCHFQIADVGVQGRRRLLTIDKNGTREGL